MIITLDTSSETPIYLQLRNEIVMGIARGELGLGEGLPTVRQMAKDIGVNTMTVNKTYQILKSEGFIEIDRRKGAVVSTNQYLDDEYLMSIQGKINLLTAEVGVKGISKSDFIKMCERAFDSLNLKVEV